MSVSPSPPPSERRASTSSLFLPASDDEDEELPIQRTRAAKPKARNSTLFLPGSDDEDEDDDVSSANKGNVLTGPDPDIDALFDDLDNDNSIRQGGIEDDDDDLSYKPLGPSLNIEQLRKQAETRHARSNQASQPSGSSSRYEILPSSSPPPEDGAGDGKKKGKDAEKSTKKSKPPKLDEVLLLGTNGIPKLTKDMKSFKMKGKGREEEDLTNLLKVYRFWSHQMYPRGHFRDTIGRVEKLCHSKRMTVALSVWRDDAHGIKTGDADLDLTEEDGEGSERQGGERDTIDIDSEDVGGDKMDATPSSPSRPPSSPSEPAGDDEDIDIDAIMRDMEEDRQREKQQAEREKTQSGTRVDDEDSAMWEQMEADLAQGNTAPPMAIPQQPPGGHNRGSADDEDEEDYMLEIMREMETETSNKGKSVDASAAPIVEIAKTAPEVDDLEDLYA